MNKNPDLFDLADICAYFNLSESTIRRKVRESREGTGNFPLPLFGSGCRVLFRKSDIESWRGADAEVITYTPPLTLPTHQATPVKTNAQVCRELKALGVRLPD